MHIFNVRPCEIFILAIPHQNCDKLELISDEIENGCSLAMFGGNQNAYLACLTEFALQNNWYPSPIAGLVTYQDWNGFDGFWQDGSVLETLVNFIHYGNHTRYLSVVLSSWRSLDELLHAYHPQPSFDDEAWYGLAYSRIYEITRNVTFLNVAFDIFNWTWSLGWDFSNACGGGFWFDGNYQYKSSITNSQLIQLGARLYRLDPKRDPTILQKVNMALNFMLVNKLINMKTYLVSEGIDNLGFCNVTDVYNYTYNTGVTIGGLVELFLISKDNNYLDIAHNMALSVIQHLTINKVLTENCDLQNSCHDNLDAKLFKGIYMRNLRYLMDVSNETMYSIYSKWIQYNVESVINRTMCHKSLNFCNITFVDGQSPNTVVGPVFGTNWRGPFDEGSPIQQTSVLDLLVASLPPGLLCEGAGCSFDPPVPSVVHIDCKKHPCPKGHACCTWDKVYHTCCTPQQTCIDGGCYP